MTGRKWSVLLALCLMAAVVAGDALGQGFGNFFSPFFAPREVRPPPVRRLVPAQRPAVAQPRAALAPKIAEAAKVLVIGDFLAGELADGLVDIFGQDGGFAVVDRSDAASGLARNERLDWTKTLPQLLKAHAPGFVVVLVGTNDRQPIAAGANRLPFRSSEWEAAYGGRVDSLAAALKATGLPVFWVGLPPMRLAAAHADNAYLNSLNKPRVEQAGIRFVDIWDAFADKEGRFVANGPDSDGQLKQLRLADGTSFTRAGQRRMAVPVEQAIRGALPPSEPLVAVAPGGRFVTGPNGQRWLVGPAISLGDQVVPAVAALAGDAPGAAINPQSVQYRLLVQGNALPAVAGRLDDFAWRARD